MLEGCKEEIYSITLGFATLPFLLERSLLRAIVLFVLLATHILEIPQQVTASWVDVVAGFATLLLCVYSVVAVAGAIVRSITPTTAHPKVHF